MIEDPQSPSAHQQSSELKALKTSNPAQENIPLKSHLRNYINFESDASGIFEIVEIENAK